MVFFDRNFLFALHHSLMYRKHRRKDLINSLVKYLLFDSAFPDCPYQLLRRCPGISGHFQIASTSRALCVVIARTPVRNYDSVESKCFPQQCLQ